MFASIGVEILLAAPPAPGMNAYAERHIGAIRRECGDRILTVGRRHLYRVLTENVDRYNAGRSHQWGRDRQLPGDEV